MAKFRKAAKSKILVTSALPYSNGPIHLGHLVEYTQTDIFVRFLRLIGEDVIYVCADDTHGAPIEIKADELGIKPEQLIAQVYDEHVRDFKDFLISFDNYYTTHSPENQHYSDLIFLKLKNNGFVYTKDIEVTYCEHCKRTLPDRYVKGKCPKCNAPDQYGDVCENCNAAYKTIDLIDPYCVICKNRPVRKSSTHYFFRLSKFSKKLESWLSKNKNLQPEIVNFVSNWIKNGLEDWNISRDGPYFGFKIPGEEDKYYYVWLDAPIGYIASTENYCKKNNLKTEYYWNSKDAKIYHFIGKDIIYFHFLFWPAMLIGSGFSLPHDIVVHGFLTVNGEKMSKSRGTFFTAREFLQKYNPEYLRFYYAGMLSKKMSDIDLSFSDFGKKVNNELAANVGNFCYRVLNFLNRNFEGKVKDFDKNKLLINEINKKIKNIEKNYYAINFNEAVKDILHISSLGNKYFQDNEPWKLINSDKEKAHKVLGLCVNIVKNLSILLEPILPNFSSNLQHQLNLKNLKWGDLNFSLKSHKIGKDEIYIRKMEEKEEKPQPHSPKEETKKEFPLNLKVAKITEVMDHPNADKLYILQIDLGNEKRQLVAGLKGHYSPEELLNKKIVVITNLKYAKLRGVESQGMLLAGDDGQNVGVLTVDKSEAGKNVYFEGFENSTKELSFDEFLKLKITIQNSHAVFEGKELKTDKETVRAEKVNDGGKVR
ncbi:methionine--tRNA ligase [Candidatus Woesearchaeota archaeon]|nr:methionine--tRNA ligase [Candidatus Woesearchaeota archaeon]